MNTIYVLKLKKSSTLLYTHVKMFNTKNNLYHVICCQILTRHIMMSHIIFYPNNGYNGD